MDIKLVLANKENANLIKNIYPLYLYDLSEIYGNVPNEYGIYEDEPIQTLAEQYEVQNDWFENPEYLFPYITMVDDKPAGFALVSTGKYAPKTTDYFLFEFFLLRPYRGKGIAETVAKRVFDKYPGKWQLHTNHTSANKRAQSFWRKTINNYTSGEYEEKQGPTFEGEKLTFRFKSNSE